MPTAFYNDYFLYRLFFIPTAFCTDCLLYRLVFKTDCFYTDFFYRGITCFYFLPVISVVPEVRDGPMKAFLLISGWNSEAIDISIMLLRNELNLMKLSIKRRKSPRPLKDYKILTNHHHKHHFNRFHIIWYQAQSKGVGGQICNSRFLFLLKQMYFVNSKFLGLCWCVPQKVLYEVIECPSVLSLYVSRESPWIYSVRNTRVKGVSCIINTNYRNGEIPALIIALR